MRLPCSHLAVLVLLCSLGSCKPQERSTLSRPRAQSGPKEPGFTRMKRKNLAVDFVIPAAFRNSLRDLLGLFPAGAVNTNFQASSSLAMDCWPLVGSLDHPGRILVDLKREQKPAPLSKVLKSGFLKSLRRSKQLLLEVGEEMIREGCGLSLGSEITKEGTNDRFEEQEDPRSLVLKRKLEFDLAELFSWWLKSKEGRLRIRLMPQRSAFFPGREDILSAALRASQPRLTFQILRKGYNFAKVSTSNPLNIYTWNISWTMKEAFPSAGPRARHDFDCNFESPCDLEYLPTLGAKSWRITTSEELLQRYSLSGPPGDYSENSTTGRYGTWGG
ncbi:ALK tyrosine kinase receptor-like [Xenopus laevis]|uniref:ALK tyrosine kinase receptor-like n=1 Tax=Xenopus laevis TaxID=8355 RepID=A0A8J1KV90_XENLA|nr:ALK tyrosine kinase receptor-like [Xenopus laevis]